MACTTECKIREPVFTEQALSFKRQSANAWQDVPTEAEENEADHGFKEEVRTAANNERDGTWESTVIEECTEAGCICERTDTVLAGPTTPPKARQVSGIFQSNHRNYQFKLRLKRAWQTVQGLCVPNDEDHALQDVSFEPEEQSKA